VIFTRSPTTCWREARTATLLSISSALTETSCAGLAQTPSSLLLRAWGGGGINEGEAVEVVLRELAAGVIAGTITPLEATSHANAINVRTDYQYEVLRGWCDLHEELGYLDSSGLSYLGRDQAMIEADVLALARSLAG
jgi:hypothetical protein